MNLIISLGLNKEESNIIKEVDEEKIKIGMSFEEGIKIVYNEINKHDNFFLNTIITTAGDQLVVQRIKIK